MGKHDIDHRADQLNPNNDAFWTSRDWDERPDDWEDRAERDDTQKVLPRSPIANTEDR